MFLGILIFAKRLDWMRRIGLSILVPNVFLLLTVTIFLRSPSDVPQIELVPFRDFEFINTNDFSWFQFRANILLFIPMGLLLPMIKRKPLWLPLVIGIGFSFLIELTQLVTHRGTCETDDVISNSFGLLIGFSIFWLGYGIVWMLRHRFSKEYTK